MLILGLLGEPAPIRKNPSDAYSEWSSGWYHHSAAVIIRNDQVLFGIEEERLNRRTRSGKFPFQAIKCCLDFSGVTLDQLDWIAFGERGGIGLHVDNRISSETVAKLLGSRFPIKDRIESKVRLVEHHTGHAMLAIATSGFDQALLFTADGFGDGISGSVIDVQNSSLTPPIYKLSVADSLGGFYSAVLPYFGYSSGDEYKIMGLAANGDALRYRHIFDNMFNLLPEGRFVISKNYQQTILLRLKSVAPGRESGGEFHPAHRDIAAALQACFEELCFHLLRHYRSATGHTNLCFSGGVAQNSTFTGKLLASGLFSRIYVPPAPHDGGIALGAALYISSLENDSLHRKSATINNNYWGSPILNDSEIMRELGRWSEFLVVTHHEKVCEPTASLICDGAVVGWVQGRSEFGPRALGNRSILADPRFARTRELVNRIKNREQFRPLAPAVLVEEVCEYFCLPPQQAESSFMSFAVPVREDKRGVLQAVTHTDGTARVQTVSKETNLLFWHLIRAFADKTSIPVLLNTSFNRNGEPIINSVKDAITTFLTTELTHLVVGNFIVTKRNVQSEMYLRLRVSLPTDHLLMRWQAVALDGTRTFFHSIVLPGMRKESISSLMFQILGGLMVSLEQISNKDLHNLGMEVYSLWRRGIVILEPQ